MRTVARTKKLHLSHENGALLGIRAGMKPGNSIIICYTKRGKLGVNFSGRKPVNEWTLSGNVNVLCISDTREVLISGTSRHGPTNTASNCSSHACRKLGDDPDLEN
jgi:hypothetical protein